MAEIRYVKDTDKHFWYHLDKHLPETEFNNKVLTKRGYVLLESNRPIGLLRYIVNDVNSFCLTLGKRA